MYVLLAVFIYMLFSLLDDKSADECLLTTDFSPSDFVRVIEDMPPEKFDLMIDELAKRIQELLPPEAKGTEV